MKKNLFLGMLAAVGMLFATSCSTDEPEAPSGNDALVSFSLDLAGATQTRAISDGSGATRLVYAVYKIDGNNATLLKLPGTDDNSQFTKEDFNPAGDNVTLTLAKGQTYTAVFWAQNPDCAAYATADLKNVAVNYAGLNNDESRDAFFKAETFTVSGDATINVTLKRPFAQINVGVMADDWEAAVAAGTEITESKVIVKNASTHINLLTGEATGSANVTYGFAAIPEGQLSVDADGDGTPEVYQYLSMSYVLTQSDKKELNDLEFVFKPAAGQEIVFHEGLDNVPIQRNWRTNIVGDFLTDDVTFNIVVDPAYNGDYNYPEYETIADGVSLDAANKTYYLSSVNGLKWFQQETENKGWFQGYTVKLSTDIELEEPWTPVSDFKGTFDGCNYTIRNMKVTTTDGVSAGFFVNAVGGTIKNLKMENVTVRGEWKAGAIAGNGLCTKIENCHVNGGTIISTPRLVNGVYDDANNVGGITGYLSAEPNAWVKNCTVNNLEIMAYRDIGGIVGTAQGGGPEGSIVTDNTVSNTTITANQIHEYGAVKPANAGEIVGRNLKNSDLSTNTATNNVRVNVLAIGNEGTVTVDNDVPLAAIANITNEAVQTIALASDIEGVATVPHPYGGKRYNGIHQPAGVTIDGGGHSLTANGSNYVIMAQGGTIKDLAGIEGGERGIVTYGPTEDVIIENVVISQPGYALNTAEAAKTEGLKLIVRNTTLNGWSSWAGGFVSAEFTDCSFGENPTGYWQKYGYPQMMDRLMRPYIPTIFTNCNLVNGFHVDLSMQKEGSKIVFDQCAVDGTILTADNYADLINFEISEDQQAAGGVAVAVENHVEFR